MDAGLVTNMLCPPGNIRDQTLTRAGEAGLTGCSCSCSRVSLRIGRRCLVRRRWIVSEIWVVGNHLIADLDLELDLVEHEELLPSLSQE